FFRCGPCSGLPRSDRQALAGLGGKEMRLAEVEAHLQLFAAFQTARIEHARYPLAAGKFDEHQSFIAERLGNGDGQRYLMHRRFGAGMQAMAAWEDIVRTQAQGNLFTILDAAFELAWQRQLVAVLEHQCADRNRSLLDIHRRRADEAGDETGGWPL